MLSSADGTLVSIGVPTYNRATTLARTLSTALGQTHRTLEVVVSDQASSDGTEQLCRSLAAEDARLRYVRQPTNDGGSTANFNLLASELRGPYAMLLADDDWLDLDYVERCLALLLERPDLAVAYGRARYFDGDRHVADGVQHAHVEDDPAARVRAYFRTVDDNGVMYGLMRGDVLRRALPMPNALGNDWLLMGRAAAAGKIATIEDVHVHRAIGGTSASVDKITRTFGVSTLQARLPHLTIAGQVLADVGWRSDAYASLPRPARLRTGLSAGLGAIHWRSLAYHAFAPAVDRAGSIPVLGWTTRALAAARRRWGGDGVLDQRRDDGAPPAMRPTADAVPCRLCGDATAFAFTAHDRYRRVAPDPFRYVRCEACGTLSLADAPEDLGRFYPADYYGVPDSADGAIARDPNAAHRLELVRSLVDPGRLVEIGPSIGGFLALAQRSGYEVSGIEQDPDCCRFIEQVLGVPVTQTVDPPSALVGPYDAIVGWHVVEHLDDPSTFVERAAQALAPGGVLVLIAPNPQSLQLRVLGSRWVHVDAPRHLALLPLDALAREGQRHGLEVVLATTDDEDARGSNFFGWRESLAASTTRAPVKRALRAGGVLLSAAAIPLERRGTRGASYTVALRRPGTPDT